MKTSIVVIVYEKKNLLNLKKYNYGAYIQCSFLL